MNQSISRKAFILAFSVSLGAGLLLILTIMTYNYFMIKNAYNQSITSVHNSYLESIAVSAWAYDKEQLDSIIAGIKRVPYVADVSLTVSPFYQYSPKLPESLSVELVSIPIHYSNQIVAELVIYLDNTIIMKKMIEILLYGFVMTLFFSFVIGYAIITGLRHIIVNRLENLSKQLTNQQEAQLNVFLMDAENAPLELTYIQQSLNDLFNNIAKEKRRSEDYQKQLEKEANYDALTNLPNRNHAANKIQLMISQHEQASFAAIFINFGSFKTINETFGRVIGNKYLFHIARKLQRMSRNHYCARIIKDNFLLILPYEQKSKLIKEVESLIEDLSQPIEVFGASAPIQLKAFVGISLYPETSTEVEGIFTQGEIALRLAKKENTWIIYNPIMDKHNQHRNQVKLNLPSALHNKEFFLNYQPIIDTITHQINGMECLIRWKNPKLGMISPDLFIEIAEEDGLINDIEHFVFEQAMIEFNHYLSVTQQTIDLSLNVSYLHFKSPDFVDSLQDIIAKTGFNPQLLKLEITERIFLHQDQSILEKMQSLIDMGIRFAIDDFGTGYSAISYVKTFPFHTLKIDKSFISAILNTNRDLALVKNVIQMSHDLGLWVVAEGVEQENELSALLNIGCNAIQGYYFSKPNRIEFFIEHTQFPVLKT